MKSVLAIDPGENTGWVFRDSFGAVLGGVIFRSHLGVAKLIRDLEPDVVVFERFNLYPGKAAAQSYSSFYTVEIIGVIKYICQYDGIKMIAQAPSDKKYAGELDQRYWDLRNGIRNTTEHLKDAFLHLQYYEYKEEKKPR